MAAGEVISTFPASLTGGTHGYVALQGTSMASPLVAGIATLLIEAGDRMKSGNLEGLNPNLVSDMRNTGFQARNTYEVHEMLRSLSERPNEHDRETGYGRLVGAYELVKGEVTEDM